MRHIDLSSWPRLKHFRLFKNWRYPHFGMTANLDLSAFHTHVHKRSLSFSVSTAYVLAQTANRTNEFKYRIRGEEVVEHKQVHPSVTVLHDDERFSFCRFEYNETFSTFYANAKTQQAHILANPSLKDGDEADDLLFMTAIPWVSFTSFMHPVDLDPVDSIPRFAWGRLFDEGGILKMPLNIQAHHGLMDGIHMGRFFEAFQEALRHPEKTLQD